MLFSACARSSSSPSCSEIASASITALRSPARSRRRSRGSERPGSARAPWPRPDAWSRTSLLGTGEMLEAPVALAAIATTPRPGERPLLRRARLRPVRERAHPERPRAHASAPSSPERNSASAWRNRSSGSEVIAPSQAPRRRSGRLPRTQRAQNARSPASRSARCAGSRAALTSVPGGPAKLERSEVVVREHLGVVLRASQRLRATLPPAWCFVRPAGARDLAVRDITDEQVAEGVLRLAGNGRTALTPHELLRSSSCRRSSSVQRSPLPRWATAPSQKTFPSTDASWSTCFSSGESASRRAATIPCTVSGSSSGCLPSATSRANSSA